MIHATCVRLIHLHMILLAVVGHGGRVMTMTRDAGISRVESEIAENSQSVLSCIVVGCVPLVWALLNSSQLVTL